MPSCLNRLTFSFFCSLLVLSGCGGGMLMASGTSAAASTLATPGGTGSGSTGAGGTGTGSSGSAGGSQVSVSVTGAGVATIGNPVQYRSFISGTSNTGVTWTLSGAPGVNYGTISASGLYTPPASVPALSTFYVVATSAADTTKSSAQPVTLSNPTAAITSATFTPGYHSSFLVDVYGTGFMPISQAQYLGYGAATTYVSPTHLQFTIAAAPAAGTIEPISVINPAPGRTQSGSFSLTIPATVAVGGVTGGTIAAAGGQPMQYTAAVTGTSNTAVTWAIKGTSTSENYGTLSTTGLYTPPPTVPLHTGISIVATSTVDTTKSAAAAVTIQQPTPAITGAELTISGKNYLVDVLGSGFVPTSSAVPGSYGVPTTYVNAGHLQFTLTNPPAVGTSVPLSVINPAPGRTQSASYNLVISTAVGVSLTGSAQALIGTPVQYTATVSGTTNTAVTWTISGAASAYGTISASGLYTPPATVPGVTNFTLTATSVAYPTKSASMNVVLSNPVPVITSATLTPGYHSSFLVDVYGTGFLPSSQAQYLGYGAGSTYLSGTHLQFTINNPPAPGTIEPISVITPAPGRTQSTNYNMTIPAPVAVTAVAGEAVTTVGTATEYMATVTGTTNKAVTWTITGVSTAENYGTISSTGLYTPPATVPAHNYITIWATSTVDTTKSAGIPVTIMNTVPEIESASTAAGASGSVNITVRGVNFLPTSSVWFSGYGLATTYVSPTQLTANMPHSTVAAQTAGAPITLWVVTPNPGRTQSANFSVGMPGSVGVTITGSSMVGPGGSARYAAAVTGSSNTAVTWSVTSPGGDAGTISAAGVYTPPASIPANTEVTVTATSVAQPSSFGSLTVNLVTVPLAAAVRLLDQSTFGPNDALVQHVQTIGLSNFVDEQLALPPTLMQLTSAYSLSCGSNPGVCIANDWWADAVEAPDQLRQRVSMALQEFLVVSFEDANPAQVGAYSNMLTQDAFSNWTTIMHDMTLSPGMGSFLNMANSAKAPAGQIANENFARENMQLFNLGLNMLNQDGSLQTDSSGNPIPAYTEAQVQAFAKVFTGWTYAPPTGSPAVFPLYSGGNAFLPMIAFENQHDTTAKTLLNTTLPAGQTAEQDLAGAIQDVFNHPNVGPFVTRQLITHLVKSNPSPAYISRMAAVFANDGTGVRGNMAAVVKAILLDPEARAGDVAPVENDGYLREPILWTANVLRALNAVPKPGVTDNSAFTAIPSFSAGLQEPTFYQPTVFNFYPASYPLQDSSLNAPQFALETSATIMVKLSAASSMVNNLIGKLMVDLSATSPWGQMAIASNDMLLDELSNLFLHGTMSAQTRSAIETALSGISDPAQRVRMAVYLVITSSEYKVIH